MQQNRQARIPDGFDFASLPCLSTEEVEKLTMERPQTLEAAGNIPGITPKALLYLYNELQATQRKKTAAAKAAIDAAGRAGAEAGRPRRPPWQTAQTGVEKEEDIVAGQVIES